MDPNKERELAPILNMIIMWIQDAHLILHEDPPPETRAYLAAKGAPDVKEETREVIGVQ